jgi:hypothetical protein
MSWNNRGIYEIFKYRNFVVGNLPERACVCARIIPARIGGNEWR